MPGVSGAPKALQTEDNPWANSGFGLFMMHRICNHGGAFTICSGDAMMRLAGGKPMARVIDKIGTLVGMTVLLDQLRSLNQRRLAEIANEGTRIAKSLTGANVTASTASVNLRMTKEK